MQRSRKGGALAAVATLVAGAVVGVSAAPAGAVANPTSTVFINEIHYDNAGVDAGEAVEVAGPAGTDLSGWQLVPYNGNGGAPYSAQPLAGTLTDQGGECGTVSVPISGLQNGAPDGIALVDASGSVVQFLSYEGTFTAVGGPASGQDATDIGVTEDGSGALGNSLQLSGTGSTYGDFAWSPESTNTFGAPNTDQTFTCTAVGDGGGGGGDPTGDPTLVVNEVDYDQPGTDVEEYVEIKNVSDIAIDLSAYSLVLVNGANDTVYQTYTLTGSLDAGAYFVVCGNAANTPNCDLDVSPDTNLIQNGAPDAVAIVTGGAIVDTVSYEGEVPGYVEGIGAPGDPDVDDYVSISRLPDGSDTDDNSVDFGLGCSTPGTTNTADTGDCPAPTGDGGGTGGGIAIGVCGDPATLISAVQGSGATSPIVGQQVVIEGVVVGDFQSNDQPDSGTLDGFYVQEQDADSDGDPATSEGVFVFAAMTDVSVGDLVRVAGTVKEYTTSGSSLTELDPVTAVLGCGPVTVPAATTVTLPADSTTALERYEGMLVTFPQDLVISEYFNYDRFGEIVLAAPPAGQDRPFQPTAVYEPGSPEAIALADYNARSMITLDDGSSSQNPEFVRHPDGTAFTLANRFRGGDLVGDVTGVIDDTFGIYRVQPTTGADYQSVNPRPAAPEDVGGDLTVASANVLNYFLTLDEGSSVCGPDLDLDCRGANSDAEFQRQRAKIIAELSTIGADVFGLIELENTTGVEPLADIVDGLNATAGPGTYDFIDTGTIGTDAIKVGLVYRTDTVEPIGDEAILDSSVDPRFVDTKNRPALAQTFASLATGERFTVTVNHLKSKGSDCNDLGDPDTGDGQANCNLTRQAAAEALVDWLATDPTGSGDPDFLIIGDLNSYDHEDPIESIVEGADDVLGTADDYTDLILAYQGELAYSYLFGAQFGYLDYALSSATLTSQVTGATEWHVNADEPDLLDYNLDFKSDAQIALYAPDPYRSSDHDPVIVGLALDSIPDNPTCLGRPATIVGTPGDDDITGTNRADVIVSFGGHDRIDGGNGDDLICSGDGDDMIAAGNGNDVVYSDAGDDTVSGGNGDDLLVGGDGDDRLSGDRGTDFLFGGTGDDELVGGPGLDFLFGGRDTDACSGEIRVACEL